MSRDQGGNSVGAMEFEQITYRVDEGVATVTLNRPERLNAFTHRMCRELIMACDLAEADHEVRVVVLTGSGRAFCAGADLDPDAGQFDVTDMGAGELIDGAPPDASGIAALRFAAMRKPTIAAINGDAIGVGITMTLPMNIRIASTRARVGFVFTRRALVPEAASSWFLPRIVGIARAVEWVTTARIVLAEEACASGLISHLHPDDDLLPAANALAKDIAQTTSPRAQSAAKHMLWSMMAAESPWVAHRLDSRVIHQCVQSPDFAEAVSAFLQKRPPSFSSSTDTEVADLIPRWVDPDRHSRVPRDYW